MTNRLQNKLHNTRSFELFTAEKSFLVVMNYPEVILTSNQYLHITKKDLQTFKWLTLLKISITLPNIDTRKYKVYCEQYV